MTGKFICIHAHFYQPPRENPWLEEVETEPSAAPFHDWNQRITRECYAPNATARILGKNGMVRGIVNNYEKLSFNFGPTLLSWMERHEPDTYRRIVEADRASIRARSGHGNAIAQVFNHSIMPLNGPRDKETQIVWGIKDFEYRFGRKPEGMWFAETAVDAESLALAAKHGIAFTILSPRQAWRVRPLEKGAEWTDVNGNPDPLQPYLYRPDGGHEMALFFYEGDLSHQIAFNGALNDGVGMARMLTARFTADAAKKAQLMHIATDGESYGHHHKFGEMALASAMSTIEKEGLAAFTNYGEFLANHPPRMEADIIQNSSWSCAHGVERWRSDCGCSTGAGAGWNQKWRAPLRNALDHLKQKMDALFEEEGAKYFISPWEARNNYVEVTLNRQADRVRSFFARHQKTPLSPSQAVEALKLLEMQKMAMRMFTSCGWFFADVAGLEAVQILKYAARAMDLAREVSLTPLEEDFLKILRGGKSNIPEQGTGDAIFLKQVAPLKLNPMRVAAHVIITDAIFGNPGRLERLYGYRVEIQDRHTEEYLETSLTSGVLALENSMTTESKKLTFCLLHLAAHDYNCYIHPFFETSDYLATKGELSAAFHRRSIPEIIRTVEKHFGQTYFTLTALFEDERRRAMERLMAPRIGRFSESYEKLFADTRELMDFHTEIGVPVPDEFRVAAAYVYEKQLAGLFTMPENTRDHLTLTALLDEAAKRGIKPDLKKVTANMTSCLEEYAVSVCADTDCAATTLMVEILESSKKAGITPALEQMQNTIYPHYRAFRDPAHPDNATLKRIKEFGRLLELLRFETDAA